MCCAIPCCAFVLKVLRIWLFQVSLHSFQNVDGRRLLVVLVLQGLDLYFQRFLLFVVILSIKLCFVLHGLDLPSKNIHLLKLYIDSLLILLVLIVKVDLF